MTHSDPMQNSGSGTTNQSRSRSTDYRLSFNRQHVSNQNEFSILTDFNNVQHSSISFNSRIMLARDYQLKCVINKLVSTNCEITLWNRIVSADLSVHGEFELISSHTELYTIREYLVIKTARLQKNAMLNDIDK